MSRVVLTQPMQGEAIPRGAAARIPFDEVYREFLDPIYRYCVSQIGSLTTAEDIAAETFAAAYGAYERFHPGSELRPWLFRIARNKIIDHQRRTHANRRLLARLTMGASTQSSSVEELGEVRDSVRKLVTAIRRLSPRDRELVGLRLAGTMGFRDIAQVTGMNTAAAQKATERALHRLRHAMEAAP
jgi:RNA polymerase sigma factor (sigma-70 family)